MADGHARLFPAFVASVIVLVACVGSGCATDSPAPSTLTFDRSLRLEETSETSANASMGDVNGDGHLDVLLVKGRHWPLKNLMLLGDGTGAFRAPEPIAETADRSYSGVLVDIDADGDLDVVVSNDRPDEKGVFLNDGTGSFTRGPTVGRRDWPTRHVRVADMNADGWPDVIFANRTGPPGPDGPEEHNFVCFGEGGGRFAADCVEFSEESATTVTPADFDGDGRLDLAVPHRDGGQSHIYLQGVSGSFDEGIPFGPADAAVRSAEAADFDADGVLDLVVIDERTGPSILWGGPGISFEPPVPLRTEDGPSPYALAVADVNGDRRPDIIVGNVEARPVVWFAGAEPRTFVPVRFGDADGVAYGFAVGDVDEDGIDDIAMARSDAPNMLYFGAAATER
jgi:hypothetical protein